MKSYKELTDTTTSSTGVTELEPKIWLKKINEAAKSQKFFAQFADTYTAAKGTKDLLVPYRKGFAGVASSDLSDQTGEGSAITFDEYTDVDGVTFTPGPHSYGIAVSQYLADTNALNILQVGRENIVEFAATVVEDAIATAITGATDATSTARGAQNIYGGDATSTASLTAGDTLTPDSLRKARRYLRTTVCKYWSGGVEAASSQAKNPWNPDATEFVMFIAPEQEYALIGDSQFTNAAEYGSDAIVKNGEIGRFINMRVVASNHVTADATWGGGSLSGHECYAIVSKRAYGLVHGGGINPNINSYPFPNNMDHRVVYYHTFAADSIHDDAIVKISVLDD